MTIRPARLAFVLNDGPYFRLHWLTRAERASQAGYDVHIISGSPIPGGAIGIPVHVVELDRKSPGLASNLRSLSAFARMLRELRPDIIHTATVKPNILAGLAARRMGIPAVLSVTGLGSSFIDRSVRSRALQQVTLASYRIVAAPSNVRLTFENPDDQALFRDAGIAPAERLVLIPGAGVDVEHFIATPQPVASPMVVMMAARMLFSKGVETFIRMAGLLRGRGVEAQFVLVGTPDDGNPSSIPVAQLEAWAREGVVEWWGGRSDMPATLKAASIVCLPTVYREGVPRVLIEAAACARPLVASDLPGCREICRDGVNGILVTPGSVEALAAAVEALLADPVRCATYGAAGRRIAVDEFREQLVIERTLAVYRDLLAGRS